MKPYERPTLIKLTPAQAQLKLARGVSSGSQAAKDCLAKDCLGKMFPADARKSAAKKPHNAQTSLSAASPHLLRAGRITRNPTGV